MILVIADDFTGAAEMAGICLGYGLKVSLCLGGLIDCNAEVLVVSTDSRSMKKETALSVVERITLQALQMKPDFVYKKIDSVLRGFVSEELALQLRIFGLTRALVLPANPSLGRVIKNGQYFVEGIDISKTGFAKDPEFAITTPDVRQMLRTGNANMLKRGDMPGDGINVGEAGDLSDVQYWAEQVNEEFLPAGSGDFFNAILNRKYRKKEKNVAPVLQKPHLYVSGTSFAKNRALIKRQGHHCTAYITADMITGRGGENSWLEKAGAILKKHQQLIIAFDETVDESGTEAIQLRAAIAAYTKKVISLFDIKELLIEGGSTAAAIFNVLGISSMQPVHEWQRGVVQMKAGPLMVTVKPGSYDLPEAIKDLYGFAESG
jgi:uncharacterized protein YgbK (DUF1537 family)